MSPERPLRLQVYAVVRIDPEFGGDAAFTVKEVLPTQAEAESEVSRLNQLVKGESHRYFWQMTRYFPDGRDVTIEY